MRQQTILAHDRLHAVITSNPGIHVRRMAMLTGMSWNTALHHLRSMERAGRVTSCKVEGKVCWFDRSAGAFQGKRATAVLRDAVNLRLAQHIMARPGRNQLQLAQELDLATSVVHRRVVRLEEAGLVDRRPQSRSVLVFPRDELPLVVLRSGLVDALGRYPGDPRLRIVPGALPFDDVPTAGRRMDAAVTGPMPDAPGGMQRTPPEAPRESAWATGERPAAGVEAPASG